MKKQILILPFILISLLAGIWSGWIRIGFDFPVSYPSGNHGAMMVGGFIGTLICLERALGFKNKIALFIPAISSLSIFFFLIQMQNIAFILLLIGSIGLVILYFTLLNKFNEIHMIVMIGSLCWFIGNAILIKTNFYPSAVMWWIAFVFFTITGERLELSRYLQISKLQKYMLVVFMLIYIIGILIPFHDSGGYVIGFSFISSGLWLFKYDMAKKSLKRDGQHFFSGIVLLFGYGWLIVCGLFMAYGAYGGLLYDAALHSFFLGFVFSMIFAHAPIILPGVLRLQINPFHKILYIWFILLQLSLATRILSIIFKFTGFKLIGGLTNGIAILGFFITMAILVKLAKK
jgi:hypothetical protein